MSRQSEWQQQQLALGNCRQCGNERDKDKTYCNKCKEKRNLLRRRNRAKSNLELRNQQLRDNNVNGP